MVRWVIIRARMVNPFDLPGVIGAVAAYNQNLQTGASRAKVQFAAQDPDRLDIVRGFNDATAECPDQGRVDRRTLDVQKSPTTRDFQWLGCGRVSRPAARDAGVVNIDVIMAANHVQDQHDGL
jgi:hypothetical protein